MHMARFGKQSSKKRREVRRKRRGVDGRERVGAWVSVGGERGTAQIIGNRWLNKVSLGPFVPGECFSCGVSLHDDQSACGLGYVDISSVSG